MAVVRRRAPRMKALAVAKVRKISSVEQWMAILEKYKDRLVFAHFAGSPMAYSSKQMLKVTQDLSGKREYSHVIFVNVDLETPGILEAVGLKEGAVRMPLVQYWRGGQMVDQFAGGGTLAQVVALLQKHSGPPPKPPLVKIIVGLLLATGLAAAGLFAGQKVVQKSGQKLEKEAAAPQVVHKRRPVALQEWFDSDDEDQSIEKHPQAYEVSDSSSDEE